MRQTALLFCAYIFPTQAVLSVPRDKFLTLRPNNLEKRINAHSGKALLCPINQSQTLGRHAEAPVACGHSRSAKDHSGKRSRQYLGTTCYRADGSRPQYIKLSLRQFAEARAVGRIANCRMPSAEGPLRPLWTREADRFGEMALGNEPKLDEV
jgi:hypothetical protein